MINEMLLKFQEIFETNNAKVFFSPGRVNLIGEHIDYNGGLVFPCAISLGTYGVVAFNDTNTIRAYSLNFEALGLIKISLADLTYKKEDNWTNYVKGVVKFMKEAGHEINSGFDLLVYGNLPNGAGLSSSASLEMLTGKTLIDLFNLNISKVELALLGKRVENEFLGVNSGIMDQFAISLGKKDNATLLDCNTLDYKYAPVNFKNESIVIMNTNKRRELADSKYNERRAECEAALEQIKTIKNINALCELSTKDFNEISSVINNPIERKRAYHAVTENERVKSAIEALNNDDLITFGQLMTGSHTSLRDDYEVTGIELDTLVSSALKQPGVLGARMTGAGFGGCAIALVENPHVEEFIQKVGAEYKAAIGYEASFYIASTSDGPKKIN
ncbi:MAG: galactokinase [Clostridium sp.]|uniref:galactokinase n=1 Tax=Clostridium culturomicium TaxID=1499683 RepID=UPI00058DFE46|nr:galactokinase [Clostridium culturomicium]MDU4892102.1 galactokinase [Clostridium sp.]MDU7082489.1 galactokinase [Clostridium sp.]